MQFTYNGDDERDYSEVDGSALHAVPGQSYELSTAPDDGRWSLIAGESVVATAETSVTPPESPVTPAETTGE